MFDATTTRPKVGLRLPFCDKISKFGSWNNTVYWEENRPVLPVGTFAFEFEKASVGSVEVCTSVLCVERREQKALWEWASLGMCRREPEALASHFVPPELAHPPQIRKPKRSGGTGSGTSARPPWHGQVSRNFGYAGSSSRGRPSGGPYWSSSSRGRPYGGSGNRGRDASMDSGAWTHDVPEHLTRKPNPEFESDAPCRAPPEESSLGAGDTHTSTAPIVASGMARAAALSVEPGVAPGVVQLGQTRLFPGGTRAAFLDALQQHLGRTVVESKDIQGGIQASVKGLGFFNFYDRSFKVVVQGPKIEDLLAVVDTWTFLLGVSPSSSVPVWH